MPLPLSCHRWSWWWRIIIPLSCYYFLLSSRVVVVQSFQQPSPSRQATIGSTLLAATTTTATTTIEVASVQVCRHKNCCKKSPYLLQSMANLLGNDRVEETGCLAQCEQGPNVQIQFSTTASPLASSSSSPPLILHEMYDATTAAIQLEWATASAATTTPHEAEPLPKLLKAAAKVLERVMSGSTSSSTNMTPQLLGKYHAMQRSAMSNSTRNHNGWHHFIESPIRILHIPFRHRCYLVPTKNVKERTASCFIHLENGGVSGLLDLRQFVFCVVLRCPHTARNLLAHAFYCLFSYELYFLRKILPNENDSRPVSLTNW